MVFISVVICTYNRLPLLQRSLRSVLSQKSDVPFEVIVVDNNCSDGTFEWVKRLIERESRVRVVVEPTQGLSHARNCGRRLSQGDYVAFLDDDGEALEGWLDGIARTIHDHGNDLVAFGGSYFAMYDFPKPDWFVDRFGSWSGGDRPRAYIGGECICGGNMVLRRDILEKVGGFSGEFGMRGSVRNFGEESEVHLKIKRMGLKTLYSPYLPIRHLVKPSLYRASTLLRESFRSGRNAGQLSLTGASLSVSVAKITVTAVLFPFYAFRKSAPTFKTRAIDALLPLYRRIGYLFGLLDRIVGRVS